MRNFIRAAVLFIVLAGAVAIPATASAATPPHLVATGETNCGFATCSYYFTREETRRLNGNLGWSSAGEASGAAACGVLGWATAGVGALPCGLLVAELTVDAEAVKKLTDNAVNGHPPNGACFKITYTNSHGTGVPPVPTYMSTNNGKYCKD